MEKLKIKVSKTLLIFFPGSNLFFAPAINAEEINTTFTVSATVISSCSVSTPSVIPEDIILYRQPDSATNISVVCSRGTPYTYDVYQVENPIPTYPFIQQFANIVL